MEIIIAEYKLKVGVHTYKIGADKGTSVLKLVKAFQEVNGIAIPYQILEPRLEHIAICYSNARKADRELGWKAKLNTKDVRIESWRFVRR